jgi:hypothetical protein
MGEVQELNPSLDTDKPEVHLRGFPQLFLANPGIVPVNRPRVRVTLFQYTVASFGAGQTYN